MNARTAGRPNGQLKRAPYFADIERLLAAAPICSWRLFASGTDAERWRTAQSWIIRGCHAATLLPVGIDPMSLRWPSGTCIAEVTNQPGDLVQSLARALIRDGCLHAVLVDLSNPARTMHVKPAPRAQQVAA